MIRLSVMLAAVALVTGCGDGENPAAPDPPRPTTLTVSPATVGLDALGASAHLSAEVRDQHGNATIGVAVAWSSSNDAVATVDESGLVMAVGNGAAMITATAGGASGTAAVTVAQAPASVAVAPREATVAALGDTLRLEAEVFDANGHAVEGAEFSWESGNDAVATVDASGLLTAAGNGAATITATADGASGAATVTVAQEVSTVTVNPGTAELKALSATLRLDAVPRDRNGHMVAAADFLWASSDSSVATVDGSGLVTAAANGTATITATADGASGAATVTVAQEVSTVTVNPGTAELKALGATLQLDAVPRDRNGHMVAAADFLWASSDSSVATVDGSGLVTAAGNGTATITATAGRVAGTATVTVAQVVSTVRIVEGDDQTGPQGSTLPVPLLVRLVDGNDHPVTGARVYFVVDDRYGAADPASAVSDDSGQAQAKWKLGMAVGRQALTAAAGEASAGFTATAVAILTNLSMDPPSLAPAEAGKQGRDTIHVTVNDAAGAPVEDASYRWTTDGNSGWVFPAEGKTSAQGRISATWVAGWPGNGLLQLTVDNSVSTLTTEIPTRSTGSANPPGGALYVNMHHEGTSAGYSIDITPLTEPQGTYYATIQWDGGYTGLQRAGSRYDRQLQFSMWNAPGFGNAQLVARGEGVVCRTFGGEGTGQACELEYPWSVGSTYRFEVTERELNGGSAITLHVTDLATSQRRFVGTLRFARRARMNSFHMFVEDFWTRAEHCLAREVRSAAIRRAMILIDGEWQPVTVGHLGKASTDSSNPGTPGCANVAGRVHAHGLEVVIGGEEVSDPNGSIRVTIPN